MSRQLLAAEAAEPALAHNCAESEHLAALTAEARRAIALLEPTRLDWVLSSGTDMDVAVIGGGQSGVAIAFGLRRAGIARVSVFDAVGPDAVGVWNTVARMPQLRAGKGFTGLEQGIPDLTFERWFSRLHGDAAFASMQEIPLAAWRDYLAWYREATGVEVRWHHRLLSILPDTETPDSSVRLRFGLSNGQTSTLTARNVVLATGIDGFGEPYVPPRLRGLIPPDRLLHSNDAIDFSGLRGRHIGVIGAAASAFDAAAVALENGAASVHQLVRHPSLAQANDRAAASPSADKLFFTNFNDDLRWRLIATRRSRSSAPDSAIERASRHPNHILHFGVTDADIAMRDGDIWLASDAGDARLELVIACTGYRQNVWARPELAAIAPHILLWRDRMPADESDSLWADHPYLGHGFALQEREPGQAPWISRVHIYTFAAIVSHGIHVGDIGSAAIALPRLVSGVQHSLFQSVKAAYEDLATRGPTIALAGPAETIP